MIGVPSLALETLPIECKPVRNALKAATELLCFTGVHSQSSWRNARRLFLLWHLNSRLIARSSLAYRANAASLLSAFQAG